MKNNKETERYGLFLEIINEIDKQTELIEQYDSDPHQYGDVVLYQAESYMIDSIGNEPGITITALAAQQNKTKSACSQLLRKLVDKGYVFQQRNKDNHREYMLYLTKEGEEVYKSHLKVTNFCYNRTFTHLDKFSEEELKTYLEISKVINETFEADVKMSLEINAVTNHS